MHSKEQEIATLKTIRSELIDQQIEVREENEELLAHRMSRNDPEYIRLLLMKNLGLVQKGQVKVTFQ